MIKVPPEIQVRIIRPQPEDTVPRFTVKEIDPPSENLFLKVGRKVLSGGLIGAVLGIGTFMALKLCGLHYGGLETSILVGIPALLGLLASYIIF